MPPTPIANEVCAAYGLEDQNDFLVVNVMVKTPMCVCVSFSLRYRLTEATPHRLGSYLFHNIYNFAAASHAMNNAAQTMQQHNSTNDSKGMPMFEHKMHPNKMETKKG